MGSSHLENGEDSTLVDGLDYAILRFYRWLVMHNVNPEYHPSESLPEVIISIDEHQE